MQAVIIRFITILLTFAIGVSVVAGWRVLFNPALTNSFKVSESIILSSPAENRWKAKHVSSALGIYGCTHQTEFETLDGQNLSYIVIPYGSSASANRELRRSLRNVIQIIERAPKLDWNRRKVGERVVAVFPADENGKQRIGILWTKKSKLRIIVSSTLELAVDYEQKEAQWD